MWLELTSKMKLQLVKVVLSDTHIKSLSCFVLVLFKLKYFHRILAVQVRCVGHMTDDVSMYLPDPQLYQYCTVPVRWRAWQGNTAVLHSALPSCIGTITVKYWWYSCTGRTTVVPCHVPVLLLYSCTTRSVCEVYTLWHTECACTWCTGGLHVSKKGHPTGKKSVYVN